MNKSAPEGVLLSGAFLDSFNFLLSLGYESLEILKPDFNARERLLDALELDADIFVVARALEYAYALRHGDIAVTNYRAAQIISGSAAEESAPGVGLRAALDVEILGVNVLCVFCDSADRLVRRVIDAGEVAYVNEQTEVRVCNSRDEFSTRSLSCAKSRGSQP